MSIEPDIDGFERAWAQLHAKFSTPVIFHFPPDPSSVTWPDDTSFDPDTGLPFDPVVEPVSGGEEINIEVNVGIVQQLRAFDDATFATPVGLLESAKMALILDMGQKALVEGATTVTVYGERQRITSWQPDGLFGGADRWFVFTEGM
jgi:hypothetical protein